METIFTLCTNYDDDLIKQLTALPQQKRKVKTLYGKVEGDMIGGGRPSFLVQKSGWNRITKHIAEAEKAGLEFDYLLNAADGGTGDFSTAKWHKKFRKLLNKIEEAGARWVTVSSPYLLRIIKFHTRLLVRVSVFARVDDERKSRQWFDEGADRIVLDSMLVNRDPAKLTSLIDNFGSDKLELLLNNKCELGCAWAPCHAKDLAASSRRFAPRIDSCWLQCQADFMNKPVRYLVQDWIRPEDLSLYEKLGYRHFKIAGRGCSTDDLILRTKAYIEGRYDGDLMDILGRGKMHLNWKNAIAILFDDGIKGLLGLRKIAEIADDCDKKVKIDNRALDGYLEAVFRKGGCLPQLCRHCHLCYQWSKSAVIFPDSLKVETNKRARELISGEIWNKS